MSREKRSAQIRGNVFPSMREELKELIREEGNSNVVTISDWLFEILEEKLAMRAIRIAKHKGARRVEQA